MDVLRPVFARYPPISIVDNHIGAMIGAHPTGRRGGLNLKAILRCRGGPRNPRPKFPDSESCPTAAGSGTRVGLVGLEKLVAGGLEQTKSCRAHAGKHEGLGCFCCYICLTPNLQQSRRTGLVELLFPKPPGGNFQTGPGAAGLHETTLGCFVFLDNQLSGDTLC